MRNGSVSLTMLVLLVLMLLGDDGVVFLAAGLTLIVSAILIRSERSHYLRWALLSAVLFLSYEAAIGFVGLSYYGSYLLILKQQLLDLLAAPNTFRTGAYLARVAQPVFQLAGTGIATLAMFAIIPLVLLQRSRKQGWRIWSLLLPAMILVVGDIFRLGIIVTQYFTYAGYLYTYALYLAFPVTILAVVHANLGRNPVLGRKGIFGWKRTFFLTVGICVLIIAVFQINPIIQSGRINSSQDSRVDNTYMQAAGIYATNFSLGAPAETTITGPQTLFLNPSNSSSNYLLTTLLHNPVGPPFELTSMTDLYYNDGPLIIVNNLNCAKLGYC